MCSKLYNCELSNQEWVVVGVVDIDGDIVAVVKLAARLAPGKRAAATFYKLKFFEKAIGRIAYVSLRGRDLELPEISYRRSLFCKIPRSN